MSLWVVIDYAHPAQSVFGPSASPPAYMPPRASRERKPVCLSCVHCFR